MSHPAVANIQNAEGLRVALFAANYNFTRDGCNQALNRLVGHLDAAGAAVRVYSPTVKQGGFTAPGEVVSVPSISAPGRPEYRIALGLPRAIRADLSAFAPNVVHLSAPDILGYCAQRYARAHGLPAVASLHTRFETYLSYYGLGWLRPAVERGVAAFYAGCDHVVAPNAQMTRLLEEQAPEVRSSVWSRGVDRVQFAPGRRCDTWRRAAGIEAHETALLFFGRLVHEKGLKDFADTVEALGPGMPVKPVVIGTGPADEWLRARLPGAVFTGFLSG
jgi:phosphatidylinositol alpha 1,6-mannosyltransferase